jgi:arylsulfatase A-like enzyme
MKRYSIYALALVCVGGLVGCSGDDPADARPNILYIVADDLGFTDIGPFGSEIPTPNLDELAYAGVRLTNFHTDSNCQRTRVMLMSSAGPSAALEVIGNPMSGRRGNLLSRDWVILPELMRDAGYATYMAGKWDLGADEGYTPATRGFDRSFVAVDASASHFAERFWDDPLPYEEDGQPLGIADLPEDFYATEYYTSKMLEFLRSNDGEQPWFAFVPYTAPHWPLQLPDDWLDRYAGRYDAGYDVLREARGAKANELGVIPPGGRFESFRPTTEPWESLTPEERQRQARAQEIYAGMVEYMDMSVGRLIDYLQESGQLENTIIMFSSDHGGSSSDAGLDESAVDPRGVANRDNRYENFGRRGSFIDHGQGFAEAASAPFKGTKGGIYEGGLRAAAFVHYPAAISGGEVNHSFMTIMDVLPTFLEIAGTAHPGAGPYKDGREVNAIEGQSFWPHLTGEASMVHTPDDAAGWSAAGGQGALIRGDYKLINDRMPSGSGVTVWRLYNIAEDPGETRDLAALYSGLTAELVEEWEENWR